MYTIYKVKDFNLFYGYIILYCPAWLIPVTIVKMPGGIILRTEDDVTANVYFMIRFLKPLWKLSSRRNSVT